MSTLAEVKLWGETLGAIQWDEKRKCADFAYADKFVQSGIEVSPLVMPLVANTIYSFPEHRDSNTFKGLPGLLADSLPEKYGNKLLTVWLAQQGRSFESLNPVERLLYLGSRGMGALEFVPDLDGIKEIKGAIELDGLLDVAKQVMAEHSTVSSIEDPANPDLDRLIQIGTSAGGAKAKAVIAWNETTGEIQSGQGECRKGFVHYLLKLSGVANDEHDNDQYTGRLEMAYHLMALEAGITMMESRLLTDKEGVGHFMTRRFDRTTSGAKYHIQSYCGIAHQDRDPVGQCSYEHLFATARELGVKQKGINELFLRMVFNIFARNQDDHTKNHAFIMDANGTWDITPAYDICFAYKKGSKWIDLHQMMCNGQRDNFSMDDIEQAAKAANVRSPDRVVRKVKEALSKFPEIAASVGLPSDITKSIQQHFRSTERVYKRR